MSWLRGALQPADLTLRQSKPATNLGLGEHWPMLMAVGVEHLAEMPGFQRFRSAARSQKSSSLIGALDAVTS